MDPINKIINILKSSKNVVIISHVGPDGDTLGSMLGLRGILTNLNNIEKADMIIVGKVPDIYSFLPDINLVKLSSDKSLYQNYDAAITVDCAAIDRLGEAIDLFRNAKITINIDHHISNPKFAAINWIEPEASATGQVLFKLANLLDVKITPKIATALYTSILTDTGGFKFENTRPETLHVCAKLIEAGANPSFINKKCFESKPLAMVKLQARAIDQAIFTENNKIAYTAVTREMLESLNASDDHIDGISEALRQINTVEIAMVFKETYKGDTKISFRSQNTNVCEIAKFFGGGGHRLAAGCTIEKNIRESINLVLPIVKKQIEKNIHS